MVEEKLSYVQRTAQARSFPGLYISLMIDFCEKILLPHRVPFVKAWLRKTLRYSITVAVVIDHGIGKYLYWYPTHCWAQDPNLVISILFAHLEQHLLHLNLPHASTLWIQADNKYAENKNIYEFGFAAYLVAKKVFNTIQLSYLPEGHTHEDGDQEFSVFKGVLGRRSALLLEDLLNIMHTAHVDPSERPKVVEIKEVWDWKTFFTQCLNRISHHSKYRCFRFQLEGDKVVFQAKDSATQGIWSEAKECLATIPCSFPQPIPRNPFPVENDRQTRQCLPILSEGQQEEWVQFLTALQLDDVVLPSGEQRVAALAMTPPPPLPENLQPQHQRVLPPMIVQGRQQPPRDDMTFYNELFVVIRPHDTQRSNDHNNFWLGKIAKVTRCRLRIRWWVENEEQSRWIEDEEAMPSLLSPGTVIQTLPDFETWGFKLPPELHEQLNNYQELDL